MRTAFLLIALLASGPAAAQSAQPLITDPDWLEQPSRGDIERMAPLIAVVNSWNGAVTMRCVATAEGRIENCEVTAEQPVGADFGDAALQLARAFRMRTTRDDGSSVAGASVVVQVRWNDRARRRSSDVTPADVESARRTMAATTRITREEATISQPRWLAAPTRAEIAAAAPGAAGSATLRCQVQRTGELHDCRVTKREPDSMNAGRLAAVGSRFRVDMSGAPPNREMVFFVEVVVTLSAAPPEFVARPRYSATPTATEIETALRSIAAAQTDATARATLDCHVADAGALTDCRVSSATPEAAGPALMGLSSRFIVRPWSEDGYPTVGSRVRLPLRYVAD